MKVLDPQSALLTTAEVQHFLATNPARAPDKPVGGYPTVDLNGYRNVRKDFQLYTQRTSAHILTYKAPDQWMRPALSRLKALGLTKTEALMIINLGVGLNQQAQKSNSTHEPENDMDEVDVPVEVNGTVENGDQGEQLLEPAAVETGVERDDSLLLSVVIEEIDIRLTEQQQQEILKILRENAVDRANGQDEELVGGVEEMTG